MPDPANSKFAELLSELSYQQIESVYGAAVVALPWPRLTLRTDPTIGRKRRSRRARGRRRPHA